ncbi:SDR family oxidoreductase [Parvularcula dongshanensis]|uniref:Dihydroflavonol-4-reductase n=1 Tax=Parvularcula dongshanensis TaxID=1173995 RepID=A0A840I1K2_9PROT|nr:aldehyde reductase [Parvularcula dongshanensis]MBB4658161.1 dihydroflavonol-4-reductase [Parvularcula dongshanensis]
MSELILVTGGSGFIATHTIVRLLMKGYRVRATVRSEEKAKKLTSVINHVSSSGDLEIAMVDLLKDEGWDEAFEGVAGLFHMASPFPAGSPKDEDELIRPALEGTKRVLTAAKKAGVPRAVLTSSVAAVAYGTPAKPEGELFTEDDWTDADQDVGAYVKSKTLAERAAWEIAHEDGAPVLSVVNPSLVVGPMIEDDFGTSVGMVQGLLTGKAEASPSRGLGLVDVRDVAEAHVKAFETEAARGQRFIASDEWMTMADMASILREAFPGRADKISAPQEGDKAERRAPSNAKAREVLGIEFTPAHDALIATATSLIDRGLV